MGKPGQQPTPMAKDNQPRQAGWQGDPAGQETKATRKWQRTEPPNSIQINLIAGCGIHEAPCFWKSPNFYKQVLLVLCVIVKCYVHYGATYGIYNMLNQMVQREPVLACDLDDRQHMSLVNGSIEKCCGVNTGHYSIPARDKDYQGLQQPQHSWLPGTLTLQQTPGTLRLQVFTDNSQSSYSRKQEGQQQQQQQQQHIPALLAHGEGYQGIQQP